MISNDSNLPVLEDGFLSLEGGMDAGVDPALLDPTKVADAVNTAFRGGLPGPRPGVSRLDLTFTSDDVTEAFEEGLFQGAGGYVSTSGKPYILLSISGAIYNVSLDTLNVSKIPFPAGDLGNNSTLRKAWFCQADKWEIIQDAQSGTLIWDGAMMRRAARNEVPTGGPTVYGLGRIWVATKRTFVGGDIIYGDPTYGAANILRFTENQVINEGGSFSVPWQGGNITGMGFTAQTDTATGEGALMVGTVNGLYAFEAPTDRTTWRDLQQPIQRFALLKNGPASHESLQQVNGDLFFRAQDGIRSFYFARRDWNTWANTPVSNEIHPTMQADDQGLLFWASAVNFDNRLLTTADPIMEERGTVWRKVVSLDFDLVSGISKRLPPAWDGKWILTERVLQLVTIQNQNGVRAFAIGFDDDDVIGIWEISKEAWNDDGEEIDWTLVTRSFQFTKPYALKQLRSPDFWMSELEGDVTVNGYYRGDVKQCWSPYGKWSGQFTNCLSVPNRATGCLPALFPRPPVRTRESLPTAPVDSNATCYGTPSNVGYEFQIRLDIQGHLKLRKLRVRATESDELPFGTVQNDCTALPLTDCEGCGST